VLLAVLESFWPNDPPLFHTCASPTPLTAPVHSGVCSFSQEPIFGFSCRTHRAQMDQAIAPRRARNLFDLQEFSSPRRIFPPFFDDPLIETWALNRGLLPVDDAQRELVNCYLRPTVGLFFYAPGEVTDPLPGLTARIGLFTEMVRLTPPPPGRGGLPLKFSPSVHLFFSLSGTSSLGRVF